MVLRVVFPVKFSPWGVKGVFLFFVVHLPKTFSYKKMSYWYSPKNTSVLEMQIMGSKPVPSQSIQTLCGNPYLRTDLSHNRWLIYTLGGSIYPVHG